MSPGFLFARMRRRDPVPAFYLIQVKNGIQARLGRYRYMIRSYSNRNTGHAITE